MIEISRQEKELIAQRYPDVTIRRTVPKKTKRHRYYMAEIEKALHLLTHNREATRIIRQIEHRRSLRQKKPRHQHNRKKDRP